MRYLVPFIFAVCLLSCVKKPVNPPMEMKATPIPKAAAVSPMNTGLGLTNNGACTWASPDTAIQLCNDNGNLVVYNSNTQTSTPIPFGQLKVWMTCQGAPTGDIPTGFSTSCQLSVKAINP